MTQGDFERIDNDILNYEYLGNNSAQISAGGPIGQSLEFSALPTGQITVNSDPEEQLLRVLAMD